MYIVGVNKNEGFQMEEEILKALGLKQQFHHGIYEDKHGHFVIDISDFNKLGTICFIGCVYANPNQENRTTDLIWNVKTVKELKAVYDMWKKVVIVNY